MTILKDNSLIVITGITGYIASHVGLAALQAGHRVRGTVRSMERAHALKAAYAKLGIDITDDRLEFVILDNLLDQEQYEKAFKDVDGIAHVALPDFTSPDLPKETVDSTLVMLRAAVKEPSVKRIAYTSSSITLQPMSDFKDRPLTAEDWNDESVHALETASDEDKKSPMWVWTAYAAGKVLAEKAAWRFMDQEKPNFELVTILPNANFGPVLHGKPASTAGWIEPLLKNDASPATTIPPQWFIDVRDDGRLHVLALTTEVLGGKRVLAFAEPYGWNQVLSILRKNFPSIQVPADIKGAQGEPIRQKIDSALATEVMGGWISLEKSIVDFVKSLGY